MARVDWIAGSVRALSLSDRRLGPAGTNAIARHRTLPEALRALAPTQYGDFVNADDSLEAAQRGVATAALWHLRVLAGWLPRAGLPAIETIAAWWELSNIRARLAEFEGAPRVAPYELGRLASLPRLHSANTPAALHALLRVSPWGDPATDEPVEMLRYLRLRLALRSSQLGPPFDRWAAQRAAIWIAEDLFIDRAEPPARLVRRLPGLAAPRRLPVSLPAFIARLHTELRAPFVGLETPADLWKADERWWFRVDADIERALQDRTLGRDVCLMVAAALALDAWRTRAALTMAAQGGGSLTREFSDVA